MAPAGAVSDIKSRSSRRRSSLRRSNSKLDETVPGDGFEVTIPEVADPDNRLSRAVTKSRRLVISNSGQCSTLPQDDVAETDLKTETARTDRESTDSEASLSPSLFARFSTSFESRFLDGLWWLKGQSKDKDIDAPEDVLTTYHDSYLYGEVPLETKVRAALRGGKWTPLLTWLEFVAAIVLVALYVRSTYTSGRRHWTTLVEYWCAVFFTVDYLVKLYSAPVRLYYVFSITGLIDLVTALTIASVQNSDMGSPFAWFQILLVLRILRVMPVLTSWLVFTSAIGHKIFLLIVNTFGAVFIAAGVFQWVEFKATSQSVKDANNCGRMGCLTYYEALYLMIVTISTVGYGDFTAKSDWGRVVIGCTILTALVVLPVQIGKILQLASRRPYGGTFAVKKVIGSRLIIISGNLSFRMVQDFLSEFYHPSHSKDMPAYPIRVVILAPYKPSFELKSLLFHYEGLVEFIEGTPTKDTDLDRVSAKVASAFFLLADQHAKDPDTEDAAQIVRTLTVHRYCGSGVRVIVEMLKPERQTSAIWDDAESEIEIICPEEIRFKLLARGCYIKGLSTFVTNLFRSGLRITNWPHAEPAHWMNQYSHGMQQGVFPVILPPYFAETLVFEKAVELVYSRYRVILFGLDAVSKDGLYREVLLYPRGRMLKSSDVGLVIAKNLAQAEQVSQFGRHQSLTTCTSLLSWMLRRPSREKLDNDLLNEVVKKHYYSDDDEAASQEYAISFDHAEEMNHQSGRKRGSGSGGKSTKGKESVMEPILFVAKHGQDCRACPNSARSSCLTLEDAVDRAMSWPPLNKSRQPEPPVLERREDAISVNLRNSTLKVVSLEKPHILVCIKGDWPSNLFIFVSHLRTSVQPNPPIVILHPEVPSVAKWGSVGMFDNVYFVKGSPVYELDLVRAGVLQAEKVVILTQSNNNQYQPGQEPVDDGDVAASLSFTSDVENVLIAATVERLQQPTGHRLITELQDDVSIQYLRPKFHIKRQQFDHEMYQRNRHASFQYVPSYIEGKGFCPSALTFLLYSSFFNRNTVNIVESFISGGQASNSLVDGQKVPALDQIEMPKQYVGVTFKDLFLGMLWQEHLLALGLHRPLGTHGSVVPYVYTNPIPEEVMEAGDLVYVLH